MLLYRGNMKRCFEIFKKLLYLASKKCWKGLLQTPSTTDIPNPWTYKTSLHIDQDIVKTYQTKTHFYVVH